MDRRSFFHHSVRALMLLWAGIFAPDSAGAKSPSNKVESSSSAAHDRSTDSKLISRVAFGSCALQDRPQPIWDSILATKPDLFLFIGDNIYADTEDMKCMQAQYDLLAGKPGFAKLRAQVPLLATWDDHDYGINDGGAEYPQKEQSKKLLLDFFNEPAESPRRRRPGIYTSYYYGSPGCRLQVILLDLRWFRSRLNVQPITNHYLPNTDASATLLGAAQWSWLEQELKKPADLRIIASSIQFVSPEHRWEKWANFPQDKERMLALLDRMQVNNAFVISGDMHYGELSREKTPQGFTLYDLTASGINQFESAAPYKNRNRISVYDTGANFGFIDIDWNKNPIEVKLQVRSSDGKIAINKSIGFPRT